jgi:hypothetical protein
VVTVDIETIPPPDFAKVLATSVDPAAPEFVIAAAKNVAQAAMYWPGKDYPDRDDWLKKRAAQREKPQPVVIYSTQRSRRQPLALGINQAKRMAAADTVKRGENPNPKKKRGCRQSIVVSRHGYYRDRYEAQKS